jgi:phospholipid/cholesterol/gamma-HCH transport system substrate-binding protein
LATRKEKVDAGLFLLIGVLLLAGTIAIVAGVNLQREGDHYLIKITKSVGGLREGSVVKYLGVNVGRVKAVDFPPDDIESVRVLIEITRPSTPLKSGTFATLSSNFLTGETSIELQGGSNEEARLIPESLIPWRPSTFMRLEDSLPGVIDELKRTVSNLNVLLGEENRGAVTQLLGDVDKLAVEVREALDPLRGEVKSLRESLAGSGDRIALAATGLREDVTASVASGVTDLKAASKSVERAADRLNGVTGRIGEGADGVPKLVASVQQVAERLDQLLASADVLVDENREGLKRTLEQFSVAARELEALLADLKRNPSNLIFSEWPPERERGARPAGKPEKGGGP